MSEWPKRPRTPHRPLTVEPDDIRSFSERMWRIHPTVGRNVLGWNVLRQWGPAANCRWDPHPEPTGEHPGEGVMYTATDLATAVLESFQHTRRIDPHSGNPRATSWSPIRPLRLLDLTDDWCLRNGASAALCDAPRATCRAWSQAIRSTFPDLDGLVSRSVLTGRPNITVWSPAESTFPELPYFSEYLADDLLWDRLDRLAVRFKGAGYRLI